MGARDELTTVQTAIETARGAALGELLEAEKKLLDEHVDELLGPLGSVAPELQRSFGWRRGWLEAVESPFQLRGAAEPRDFPLQALRDAADHAALRRCRSMTSRRWPGRLPPAVEELVLSQAVLTEGLLAHRPLRSLSVRSVVACAPLRHAALRRLALSCFGPVVDALGAAELPELDELRLDRVGFRPTSALQLATAIARLPVRHVSLQIVGKTRRPGWGLDDVRALEPIGDRIAGLSLFGALERIEIAMPNLRRLRLVTPEATTLASLDFPGMEELLVCGDPQAKDATELGRALADSPQCGRLRKLHWEGGVKQHAALAALASRRLEALEEVSFLGAPVGFDYLAQPDRTDAIPEAFLQPEVLPNVRTVSVAWPYEIEALAASPLAAQVEVLALAVDGARCLEAWLRRRERFPRLRTLVVRGWQGRSIENRIALTEGAHEIVWAEGHVASRRRFFDRARGAAGMGREA